MGNQNNFENTLSATALADRMAIVDLTVAYTWALDTREFDGMRKIFTENATANLRGVHCDGVEAIIERISGAVSRLDATQLHAVASCKANM
jgi:hypothetical protein